MTHALIDQLYFTRAEFLRGIEGVSEADGARHLGPMNCIGWTVGHMAWHEQRSWLQRAQGRVLYPVLNELYAYRAPMSTPSLAEMLALWNAVTQAAGPYLDGLTTQSLQEELLHRGSVVGQPIGSVLRRVTYHYWYHTGEIQAMRQMLGHADLPEYVGDIEALAPYRPE